MAEHVIESIGAYLDGEYPLSRQSEIKAHLESCQTCRIALEELQELSDLFQEDNSVEGFTPHERFMANLMLQLPRLPVRTQPHRMDRFSWWLAPAGITIAWVFMQTLLLVNGVVSIIDQLGLTTGILSWLPEAGQHTQAFLATMGLFGQQLGEKGQSLLTTFDQAALFGKDFLTPILWQVGIVAVYWMVMVTGFLRRDPSRWGRRVHLKP